MKTSRPLMFLLVLPVVASMALGAVIFGGEALSDSGVEADIQRALASQIPTSSLFELRNLQEVQYGYGICGSYRALDADAGYASFFYDTVNHKVVRDVNAQAFTSHCSLSAICRDTQ